MNRTVLVTGGAGYVGSVLVRKLVDKGYRVRVLDLFLFGREVLADVADRVEMIQADLRDASQVEEAVRGASDVIHLACISNDPSFELNPTLGKSINYDAFEPLVQASRKNGVSRFVYASSSSVYGVKQEEAVTEDLSLEPLTDYSKYKAACEEVLLRYRAPGFTTVILRPATVCGYSPRLRLDLSVNILTNHAVNNGVITVFGGPQLRPHIHIEDVSDLYVQSLEWPAEVIDGQTYNAGYQNRSIDDVAFMVRDIVGHRNSKDQPIRIERRESDDKRSYRISSDKIRRELGFEPQHTIEDAIQDLCSAFTTGKIPNPMTDDRYYNIRTMKRCSL